MTLTFDPLTLKVCGRSGVTWSQSVVNLSEIEQSAAELLTISPILGDGAVFPDVSQGYVDRTSPNLPES